MYAIVVCYYAVGESEWTKNNHPKSDETKYFSKLPIIAWNKILKFVLIGHAERLGE